MTTNKAMAMQAPDFPHYSVEAAHWLGLPDSPVIQLAVTTLVDMLLPLAEATHLDTDAVRRSAFRVASGTVLEGLPFECAAASFLDDLGLMANRPASELAYRTKRTDWLGQAHARIVANGDEPGPDAKRMATRYGWSETRGRE